MGWFLFFVFFNSFLKLYYDCILSFGFLCILELVQRFVWWWRVVLVVCMVCILVFYFGPDQASGLGLRLGPSRTKVNPTIHCSVEIQIEGGQC
jgi:hypothetical protein